ncbi:MAG: hypothetical protein PHP65_05170 [Bacilli bacterium]|nr:hypothetical protein [Bacilli bacterium]
MGLFNPTFYEKYQGGLPKVKAPRDFKITFKKNEMIINYTTFLGRKKIIFNPKHIIEVSLNQQKFRSAGKAAVGAIVGGVLTGGLGLVAGAAIGGQRQTENILQLVVEYKNQNCNLFLSPNKKTQKLYNELVDFASKAVTNRAQIQSEPTNLIEDQQNDTKECPFCAEIIKAKAIVCKHCGRDLQN